MIQINDLIIDLPAELGHRAGRISRLVQHKSRRLTIDAQREDLKDKIETLALADIETTLRANDNTIAELIVSSIAQSLKETR